VKVRLIVELDVDDSYGMPQDSVTPLDVLRSMKAEVDNGWANGQPVKWERGWAEPPAVVRRSPGNRTVL
jgi:hypothetical protein